MNTPRQNYRSQNGFTLMEVLVSLGIVLILISAFFPILAWLIRRSRASAYEVQASLVLQATMEVAHNVVSADWDTEWSSYPEGIYHPAVDVTTDPPSWVLLPGIETGVEARFARQVEIQPICRSMGNGERLSGNCPAAAGNRDNNSKLLLATVNWAENGQPKSVGAELLVTNLGI